MAELARSTAAPRSVDEVLSEVTNAAVELIPGVDTAGILLVGRGGRYESLAVTTELPHRLDAMQVEFDEGPCLQAATTDLIVRTDDFRTETRWPKYTRAVLELGVRSGLSLKLYANDRSAGALNLFGFQPAGWDDECQTIASVLAAHAAAALMASRHSEQLTSALASRDQIGQAKGIIMERFGVDETRAFDLLRKLSQESQIKLVDIAARVVETRGL